MWQEQKSGTEAIAGCVTAYWALYIRKKRKTVVWFSLAQILLRLLEYFSEPFLSYFFVNGSVSQ